MKNAVAVLSDEGHLEKTKQVFYSSYKYGNWTGDYILLAHEITDESKLTWFTSRNIRVIHTRHSNIYGVSRENSVAVYYAKLQLFHPSLRDYRTIIYLDTDMIVRKDLSGLLHYDRFAAADDCFRYPLRHQFNLPENKELKQNPKKYRDILNKLSPYNLNKPAFNAGMMVIDAFNNTQERYDEIVQLARELGKYSVLGDQGVLNCYFQNSRKRIPYVYNDFYQSDDFNRQGLISRKNDEDAVILHLTYPVKPWHPDSDYREEWEKYTRAADELFDNVTPCGIKPAKIRVWLTDFINRYNILKVRVKLKIKSSLGKVK